MAARLQKRRAAILAAWPSLYAASTKNIRYHMRTAEGWVDDRYLLDEGSGSRLSRRVAVGAKLIEEVALFHKFFDEKELPPDQSIQAALDRTVKLVQ